jgi:hypothetical protein
MAPYRPNRKTRRSKKYKLMSEEAKKQEEVQAPEVNIGDFGAILQIIDVASTRGAFKGDELSSVGAIRDRVAAFVDFYTPKKQEDDKEETSTEEATTEGEAATEETAE